MINNIESIVPFLRFNLGSYHIQITQRSKDGHDKANRLVAEWFVTSENKLQFLMPAIESICNIYNARCYINLNPKKDEAVAWKMLANLVDSLKNKSVNPLSAIQSAHDSVNGNGVKYWIVDVDDPNVNIIELISNINGCQSSDIDDNVLCQIPTKNGLHLICRPFNLSQITLPPNVEVKKNASTILYCV